jgi:hypothetical protein
MAWSRLVGTVVGTLAVCGFMTTPAPAVGTWPASVQLGTSAAFQGDTVSFQVRDRLGSAQPEQVRRSTTVEEDPA